MADKYVSRNEWARTLAQTNAQKLLLQQLLLRLVENELLGPDKLPELAHFAVVAFLKGLEMSETTQQVNSDRTLRAMADLMAPVLRRVHLSLPPSLQGFLDRPE